MFPKQPIVQEKLINELNSNQFFKKICFFKQALDMKI